MIKEGSGGASFYVIVSGSATVTIGGEPRAILQAGDHFGEIALLDEGARIATITASSELVCQGLTLWEFRPLVEKNGLIAWTLMQNLAKELRAAEQALATLRSQTTISAPPCDRARRVNSARRSRPYDSTGKSASDRRRHQAHRPPSGWWFAQSPAFTDRRCPLKAERA